MTPQGSSGVAIRCFLPSPHFDLIIVFIIFFLFFSYDDLLMGLETFTRTKFRTIADAEGEDLDPVNQL